MRKYTVIFGDTKKEVVEAHKFQLTAIASKYASSTLIFYNDNGDQVAMFAHVKSVLVEGE